MMDIIPFIIMTIVAVVAFSHYLDTRRQLDKAEARYQILREREAIASRLLFSCYRKLAFDTEDTYINI